MCNLVIFRSNGPVIQGIQGERSREGTTDYGSYLTFDHGRFLILSIVQGFKEVFVA